MREHRQVTTGRPDWTTPRDLFERVQAMLGGQSGFTVDAAASIENARLPRYWTISDDALSLPWNGERVWCNPPYGAEIGAWTAKASLRHADRAVLFLPVRSSNDWWTRDVLTADLIVFCRGRVRFEGSTSNAPFPSCFVVWTRGHLGPPVILPSIDVRSGR